MDKLTEAKSLPRPRGGELTRRVKDHHLVIEVGETLKLALPMVLTQVGQIAMMTTDFAFIGRIGPEALAAASLASRVYIIIFIFGAGLLAAILPLAAQAFGADNLAAVRRSLRMGLWLAMLLSLPIMAFMLYGEHILLSLGQAPEMTRLAQRYLFGLAWGVAPALCFEAIRNFMGALNRPEPALWIILAVIPVNALLAYLLINGKFGLPRLELFGVGFATALVNCGAFLASLWFATMCRPFREHYMLAHLWRFDWTSMRQLIVIGTPISIGAVIGYGLFSATALLAGLVSNSALAAHQIAVQVAATLFMISFGISTAAAVRVSHAVGRSDGPGVKRAGLVAMLLGIMIAAMLTLAVITTRLEIAELFLGKSAGDATATIRLAAKLLLVGASFFITDAAKTIAAGSLRGLKDTRVPLLFAGIGYWLIGFSLSYVLGLKTGLGVIGIWIGISIGTTVYAGLLLLRFELLANRLALQSRS